jgi:hypothetical protein
MENMPGVEGCDPENSWLEYRNKVELNTDDPVIEHKELPQPDQRSFEWMMRQDRKPPPRSPHDVLPNPNDPLPSWWNDVEAYPGQKAPIGNPPQSKVQRRASNSLEAFFTGYAIRMCYDINPPQMVSIGGRPAIQANRADMGEGFQTMVYGNFINPMIIATWRLRYIIPVTGTPLKGPLVSV